jgi:hypothetical protein
MLLSIFTLNTCLTVLGTVVAILGLNLQRKTRTRNSYWKRLDARGYTVSGLVVIIAIATIFNEQRNSFESSQKEGELKDHNKQLRLKLQSIDQKLGTIGYRIEKDNLVPFNRFSSMWNSMVLASENRTFMVNHKSRPIIDYIVKNVGLKFSNTSILKIEITYSGEIKKLDNSLYYYPGGSLLVKISSMSIQKHLDLDIERTHPSGNELNYIQNLLEQQVEELVQNHPLIIAKVISKCLR